MDINSYVVMIQDEIQLIASMLRDKGRERFGRTLILGVGLPAAAYFLFYGPAKKKFSDLDNRLQTAQTMAANADTYKSLKDNIERAYARLPLPKDRTNWLADTVKEALRAEEIVPSQFNPPVEKETNGIVEQSLTISMSTKFPELMGFLARLETIKPSVYVTSLEVAKKDPKEGEIIARNEVSCTISTIIFTERY